MQQLVPGRMKAAQRRPKRDNGKTVGQQPQFWAGQLLYLDWPLLSAPTADRMAANSYTKLLSRVLGPYSVILSSPYTVTTGEGVPKTISSDRAALRLPFVPTQDDNVNIPWPQLETPKECPWK